MTAFPAGSHAAALLNCAARLRERAEKAVARRDTSTTVSLSLAQQASKAMEDAAALLDKMRGRFVEDALEVGYTQAEAKGMLAEMESEANGSA